MDLLVLFYGIITICLGSYISFFSWVSADKYVTGDNLETVIWRNIGQVVR